jgi:hypothetical protein
MRVAGTLFARVFVLRDEAFVLRDETFVLGDAAGGTYDRARFEVDA